MLSIIVPVHNQLGHNQLFLQCIERYTTPPYEVIVIDNNSTDGSADYFEGQGCQVIRNHQNLCYPESMNLGIRSSKGQMCCLINNDVCVSPQWNERLTVAMDKHELDACSPMGLERMPTPSLTEWMYNRWSVIGRGRLSSGKAIESLQKKINLMYGNWEKLSDEIYRFFGDYLYEGIIGACVMVRRSLLDKIGLLDERIQAADWDLYLSIRKRELEIGDVRRCMTVGGVYVHHFIRATVKGNPPQFSCSHPRISIDDKWEFEMKKKLWFEYREIELPSVEFFPRWKKKVLRLCNKTRKTVSGIFLRNLYYLCPNSRPEKVLTLYREKFAEIANISYAGKQSR